MEPGGADSQATAAVRTGRPPVHLSMAEAARIGIVIIAVASVVFLLLEPPFIENGRVFALHYGGRLVASLAALAAVRRFQGYWPVTVVLWALAAVISASSAYLGVVRGDYTSNALISIGICVGSAAIIPWRWREHLVMSAIFVAGLVVDAAVIGGGIRAAFNTHILLALVVCMGGATYTAASLDRVRRQIDRRQREDEAVIAALTNELEERVRARTMELDGANTELRSANVHLARANEELQGFTYSVSHDLRGALRVLGGQSHMMLEDHGDEMSVDARRLVEQMRAGTIRLGLVVDALLSLARVSRLPLHVERVDLSQLAVDVGAELAQAESARHVELIVEPGMVAAGDPSLLRVLIENLLSNAWKFTRRRTDARITVEAKPVDGEQVYTVTDNGVGFDARFAAKLFRPFERLHEQGDFEGTGIGLATVKRVILRHGGRVWAGGAPQNGAQFCFTLPAVAARIDTTSD